MSEELTRAFEQAANDVKRLPESPDSATLLELYGLYKQGTLGDCHNDRPGMMDFVARAKFDVWKAHEGTSQEDAQRQYIELVKSLGAGGK